MPRPNEVRGNALQLRLRIEPIVAGPARDLDRVFRARRSGIDQVDAHDVGDGLFGEALIVQYLVDCYDLRRDANDERKAALREPFSDPIEIGL